MAAQVTLFMDDEGNVHAEMPNFNGGHGRNKLSLTQFDQDILITTSIFQALEIQRKRILDERAKVERRKAESREELARSVFSNIAKTHGIELAQRAVPALRATAKTIRKVDTTKLGQNTQSAPTLPKAAAKAKANKTQDVTNPADLIPVDLSDVFGF